MAAAAGTLTAQPASVAAVRSGSGRWDEILDIVIIGSGFAGLSAAAEAADRGMKVAVIEKMARFGGNSRISHGEYAAWDDVYHLREKLHLGEDSASRHEEDSLRAGGYYGNPDLVRLLVKQAPAALRWLLDKVGLKIRDNVTAAPGHTAHRIHAVIDGSGEMLATALLKMADKNGTILRLNEKVTSIWRSNFSEPVTGVEVQRGNIRMNLYARQAVILATGGFSRDLVLRQIYNPALGAEYNSTNHDGATGEVIRAARAIGADVTQLNFAQVYPCADPVTGRFDVPSVFALRGPAAGMIFVDPTGQRFVNELSDGDTCARAQVRRAGAKKVTYALFNREMISRMGTNDEVDAGLKTGRFARGETLAELAQFLKMSPETLSRTVSEHNRFIREDRDPEFGKSGLSQMMPMTEGPFYALPQWPAVHGTLGGLRINSRAQVLDIRGNVIPRLYAAGEVVGGIHGADRLAGNGIAECIVFGRLAGTNAAEEKPRT